MKKNKICKFLFFIFLAQAIFATQNIDSLKQKLSEAKTDSQKLKINLLLSRQFLVDDPDESLKFSRQALFYSKKTGKDEYKCYLNIGMALGAKSIYGEAMDNYLNSLKVLEGSNAPDKEKYMAKTYDCIGGLYVIQENFVRAIEYKNKALSIYKKINDVEGEAIAGLNLGNVYYNMKKYKQAIEAYNFSAKVFEELKDDASAATALNNIGAIYFDEKKYEKALDYFTRSYEMRLKTKDQAEIATSLNNLGEANGKLGRTEIAIEYCLQASKIAEKMGLKELLHYSLKNVSDLYEYKGDYKNSVVYHKLYEAVKDSISTEKNSELFYELSVKYESERKEKENEILNLQLKNESFIKYIFIILAGLILITALLIYRGYRLKKGANTILSEKNKIIGEQHKDITDSIKYAQRIQQAILPPSKFWNELLPNSFVLYKPKDILSGDFYWIEQNNDFIYFAAADCTGHGVPGALMSIVNYNLLNKALLEQNISEPAKILDSVNRSLTVSLHQTYNESAVRDGMDIALCAISKKENKLHFAGAFNGGYLFRGDGTILDLTGDKKPVGAFIEEKMQLFTGHEIEIKKEDRLFIFSDGYADQFGGPNGKKLKYKKLQQYISESIHLSMSGQKDYLDQKFNEWKGNYEQVDDVLVVGICF